MKKMIRKLTAAAASLAMTAALAAMLPVQPASAANTYWKFDFGNGGVASGYTGVNASTGYDAGRGYGFSGGTSVANVGASGSGASRGVSGASAQPAGTSTRRAASAPASMAFRFFCTTFSPLLP